MARVKDVDDVRQLLRATSLLTAIYAVESAAGAVDPKAIVDRPLRRHARHVLAEWNRAHRQVTAPSKYTDAPCDTTSENDGRCALAAGIGYGRVGRSVRLAFILARGGQPGELPTAGLEGRPGAAAVVRDAPESRANSHIWRMPSAPAPDCAVGASAERPVAFAHSRGTGLRRRLRCR